ncbi:MAG: ArdC family protein [Thiogranum sp.]
MSKSNTTKRDGYAEIIDRIIAELQQGTTVPWVKPRTAAGNSMPRNALSGRAYNGVNVLLCWAAHRLSHSRLPCLPAYLRLPGFTAQPRRTNSQSTFRLPV